MKVKYLTLKIFLIALGVVLALFYIYATNEELINTNLSIEEELIFSNSVKEIFIGYKEENGSSGEIASFDKESLPTEATTYAIHNGVPYIYISFNDGLSKEQQEELLSQIKVEAKEDITIEISQNHTQYLVTANNFNDSATFIFGDISPINIERMVPLELSVENNESVIFINDNYQNFILFIPEEKEAITFTFSEAMKQDSDIIVQGKAIGKWLDEYNYEINLTEIPNEYYIGAAFNQFLSINNNRLLYFDTSLIISRTPDYSWIDYKTGEKIGWGEEYLRYYDKILFSPDNNFYIGIIEGVDNGNLYSNGHIYYTFIVHEKGKDPFIIEDIYISNDNFMGYPIQWISNEELLYDANLFNIKTKRKEALYPLDKQYIGSVHEAAYDFIDNKLYLLMLYAEETNMEEYYIDKLTFADLTSNPNIERKFSSVKILSSNFAKLPIKVVDNGIYWSKFQDEQWKVVYEGRDGYTEERDGHIIFTNNQGAVIFNRNESIEQYIWWEIGKSDKAIPFIDFIQPFGDDIVYYNSKEKQYYRYEPSKNDWVKLDLPNNAYLPSQEINQLYRR